MSSEYYASLGAQEVDLSTIPELPPMAQKLARAIDCVGCWDLVALFHAEEPNLYVLVANLVNSSIERDNGYGIRRRETLGIEVCSENTLPTVRVLRDDFPRGMHTNYPTREDDLVSICLYTDSTASILRTWTAESFLSRIEWWFDAAAKGMLHPSEQPLEQPFFESGSEIVLPHEMRTRVLNEGEQIYATQVVTRTESVPQGYTFLTELTQGSTEASPFYLIQLRTPVKSDNTVRTFPSTLKGLLHYLIDEARVNEGALVDSLVSSITELNGELQTPDLDTRHCTVILVQIPLSRGATQEVEGIAYVAFLLFFHPMQLLSDIGLYTKDPETGRYARILGNTVEQYLESGDAKNPLVLPTHVLFKNSIESFQLQSGLEPSSTNGFIVGLGALGSCIAELFARSGWGNWSYIDKDHVRPHNLTRHTSVYPQVGQMKVDVVHQLACLIRGEDLSEEALSIDAIAVDKEKLKETMQDKHLVIDATTTLEYPRRTSKIKELPRHVSLFLTPDSKSSVLLLEDSHRTIKLAALEAQYYRALISTEWGDRHLSSHADSFWSGNSCRDLSYRIPYTNVMTHASLLVDSLMDISGNEAAKITVFEKNDETRCVSCHSVDVTPIREIECNGFVVIVDEGLIEKVSNYREASLPNETGGVIVGYYDFTEKLIALVDCRPAPLDSRSSTNFFERGTEGVQEDISTMYKKTMGNVVYLGEWHSHPTLSSSDPSPQDDRQLKKMTAQMASEGIPWIQLIVGESQDISIRIGWDDE